MYVCINILTYIRHIAGQRFTLKIRLCVVPTQAQSRLGTLYTPLNCRLFLSIFSSAVKLLANFKRDFEKRGTSENLKTLVKFKVTI